MNGFAFCGHEKSCAAQRVRWANEDERSLQQRCLSKRVGLLFVMLALVVFWTQAVVAQTDDASCFQNGGSLRTLAVRTVEKAPSVRGGDTLDLVLLHTSLERALISVGVFDVVTINPNDQTFNLELERFNQNDARRRGPDGRPQGLGARLQGVDVIIKPRVDRFYFASSYQEIFGISRFRRTDRAEMDLSVETQRIETGQVSQVFSLTETMRSATRTVSAKGGAPSGALYRRLIDKLGERFAAAIRDLLQPPLVADVIGNEIWITAGSDQKVKLGDVFELYKTGRTIRNPTTGQVMGRSDRVIGSIRIVRVQNKIAVGEVLGKPAEEIAICDVAKLKP